MKSRWLNSSHKKWNQLESVGISDRSRLLVALGYDFGVVYLQHVILSLFVGVVAVAVTVTIAVVIVIVVDGRFNSFPG